MRLIACSLLVASTLFASTDELLSSLKKSTFDLRFDKNSAQSGELEYSWINPVTVSYDYSYSNQFDRTQIGRTFSIRVDQPIFKSGGIWYAIKYAKASRRVGDIAIDVERRAAIKQAIATLFNIKKSRLEISKQQLLIQNSKIDIERKKEQYLSGDIDSSFLDQAILQKNRDTINLFNLEENLVELEKVFRNLSDLDLNSIKLPKFDLVSKNEFMEKNIDLALYNEQVLQKGYFNIMTWTRYMPTLSVQGSWVKPFKNGSIYLSSFPNSTKSYYTYGFRISMPLDIKSYFNIESTRADYLEARVKAQDIEKEAENLYNSAIKRLKVIDKKISLAIEDKKLYSNLLKSTKEKVEAGELTLYDLYTLENSKEIRELDIEIYKIQKQLILLELYEKSYDSF